MHNRATTDETIALEAVPTCALCGLPGQVLHTGLRDRLYAAPGEWQFLHCPRCTLIWESPRPLSADLGRLYSTFYHYTHAPTYGPPGRFSALQQFLEACVLGVAYGYTGLTPHIWQRVLGRVLALITPLRDAAGGRVMWLAAQQPMRVLDVGCGSGQLLAFLRDQGCEVSGIEPDLEAVRVARQHYGLEVYHGLLEDGVFSDASFDAVVMSHVIEHVPDPIALLAACRRMLRPGGRVVVVTPNMASLGRRVLGTKWYLGWGPPWHLLLFDPTTIRAVATHAGLRVAAIHTSARKARLGWTVNRLLKQHRSIPDFPAQHRSSWPLRLEAVLFQALETLAVALWPVGEELVLVAQKEPA